MTMLRCTGETLTVLSDGRKKDVNIHVLLMNTTDCDLIESINAARQNPGQLITVPNTSYARGMRPRNAQRHGVIQ